MTDFTQGKKQGSIVFVIGVCVVAALGGLLFGYDTGVINGSLKFVQLKFDLSPAMKGFAASSALLACIFGAAFAGALSDRLGRKKVLILSAILFLISAVGTALPQNLVQFIIFRVIGGLGVGAASMTSPMYIAEISPARIRGRMVSLNQFAIVTGMLIVYFVNFFLGGHGVKLNNEAVTALLEKTEVSIADDSDKAAVKDAMAKQLVSQVANYKVRIGAETLEAISLEIDKRLTDQGVLVGEMLLKFIGNEATELSKYGVKLDVKTDESFVMDIAGQLAGQVPGGEIETEKLAVSIMTHDVIADLAKDGIVLDRTVVEELAGKVAGDVESLSLDAWNVMHGWRWMFGSESIPAVLLLVLLFFVPESPRWLTKQSQKNKALEILSRVDGEDYAKTEMLMIEENLSHESGSLSQLFNPRMRIVLVIGVVLAVLQQVTGINVFLYFGSEIFEKLGGESIDAALLQQVVVGAVNLLFTVIAIWMVDKLGRKPLMIVGSIGMGVALFAMGFAGMKQATGMWLLVFVLVYIASFALSVGPVVWVILSEIFPTKIRGRAMGIATICLWIANSIVSQTFPMMDENEFLVEKFNHGFPFFIYGIMCVLMVIFVAKVVPETKGKTLEEIEKMWLKN